MSEITDFLYKNGIDSLSYFFIEEDVNYPIYMDYITKEESNETSSGVHILSFAQRTVDMAARIQRQIHSQKITEEEAVKNFIDFFFNMFVSGVATSIEKNFVEYRDFLDSFKRDIFFDILECNYIRTVDYLKDLIVSTIQKYDDVYISNGRMTKFTLFDASEDEIKMLLYHSGYKKDLFFFEMESLFINKFKNYVPRYRIILPSYNS